MHLHTFLKDIYFYRKNISLQLGDQTASRHIHNLHINSSPKCESIAVQRCYKMVKIISSEKSVRRTREALGLTSDFSIGLRGRLPVDNYGAWFVLFAHHSHILRGGAGSCDRDGDETLFELMRRLNNTHAHVPTTNFHFRI